MEILEQLANVVTVERVNEDGVPSASIAMLKDGEIMARVVTNGTEDTETIYQAASISKAITALAVARLVDEGKFTYESKVAERLPRSVVDSMVEPATAHLMGHVTVAMLLSHTSGLSQHGFRGYAEGEPLPTAEEVLAGKPPANSPKVRFDLFPGARYSYSGGGFTLLQVFLESIMGQSFPRIVKDTVLSPLSMTRSHYGALKGESNFAAAHHTAEVGTVPPYYTLVEMAAAALWTTPTDLLKAIAAIQKSLHGDNGFLQTATAKKMLSHAEWTDHAVGNVLGWRADGVGFAHSGDNDPGYTCYVFGSHGGAVNGDKSQVSTFRPAGASPPLGFASIRKILSAFWYLEEWHRFTTLASLGTDIHVVCAAPGDRSRDGRWIDWCGSWGKGWRLVDEDGPRLGYEGYKPMELVSAAAPVAIHDGDKSEHVFVACGLKVAVRLTWVGDERVLDLTEDRELRVLRRA
ncbi:hypothetical protein LTR53_016807 [Teratosphaeriaceae sp. CCFEE 6253]|nr:hypothetical protein LTR53_016807 [Teratosphaeriaceae sp. CCFEE 6253]